MSSLRERCANSKIFLVFILPHLDWIQRFTLYIFIFSLKIRTRKNSEFGHFHAVDDRSRVEMKRDSSLLQTKISSNIELIERKLGKACLPIISMDCLLHLGSLPGLLPLSDVHNHVLKLILKRCWFKLQLNIT